MISSKLPNMFDEIVLMHPFATSTNIFESLKEADVNSINIKDFLHDLLLDHWLLLPPNE